jgi:hypothetical protein
MNKDLKDMTFDDLVSHAAWQIVEAITQGRKLRSEMYQIGMLFIRWNEEVTKAKKK